MRIQSGTVDHYFSKNKPTNRHLVYEWGNCHRHAAPSSKQFATKDLPMTAAS